MIRTNSKPPKRLEELKQSHVAQNVLQHKKSSIFGNVFHVQNTETVTDPEEPKKPQDRV